MVIIACSRLQESNACTEAVKTDVKNIIMSVSIFPYDLASFRYFPTELGYGYQGGN